MPVPQTSPMPTASLAELSTPAATTSGDSLAVVPVPPAPGITSIERFRNALAAAALSSNDRATASPLPTGATNSANGTLGTRILGNLHSMSSALETNLHQVDTALSQTASTLHDVMRAQFSLVSWSYQTELLTKSVAKASQDVDQLLRMQ